MAQRPALGVALLAAAAWSPGLLQPLFGDDHIHLERSLQPAEALGAYVLRGSDSGAWWTPPDLAIPYFRPLASLSFWPERVLWGLHPLGFHATNLALHVLATWLVLRVGRRLLPEAGALAAAVLFAVHPAHAEAVLWVSARADLLMTVGFLGAVDAFLGGRLLLGAACTLVALASKEAAVVLPVLMLALDRRAALLSGALAAGWLGLRSLVIEGVPPHPFVHLPGDPDFLWNAVGGTLLYLLDLVLTAPVDPVVGFPLISTAWPLLVVLGLCAAALLGSLAHRSPHPITARLGLLWLGLTLLPVLPVSVGERFLYLPSVGLCLLVGSVGLPRWLAGTALAFSLAKAAVFGLVVGRGHTAIDDALAAIDAHPAARRVVVADLPAGAALGFPHALRLHRPHRELDVVVVTLAPHFLDVDPAFASSVTRASDGLEVRAVSGPYLRSYLERAYLGEADLPAAATLDGVQVEVLEGDRDGLTAVAARYDGATTLALVGRGYHLEVLP